MTSTYDLCRAQAQLKHAQQRMNIAERMLARFRDVGTPGEIDVALAEMNDAELELALAQIALEELEGK